MICPKCGTPNRASAKFCDECGYELPSVAPIANEIFDDETHVQTCKPKSAPTADLAGVDKTNDSSFTEEFDKKISDSKDVPSSDVKTEKETDDTDFDKQVTKKQDAVKLETTSDGKMPEADKNLSESKTNIDDTVLVKNDASTSKEVNFDSDITAKMPPIDPSASKADQKVYSVENTADKYKKRKNFKINKNVAYALGIIAVVALLLGVTYYAQIWGGKVVPDVSYLPEADAKAQLQAAGFKVETEQIASDEAEGIVIAMDPGAGSRVSEGSTILLDISMRRVVPNVVGMKEDDARQVMQKNGFQNVEYVTQKSDAAEKTVLAISPEVDTPITASAKITITISEAYRVPDVTGLTEAEAIAKIKEAGYTAKTVNVNDESKTEGTVLSTSPEKDNVLKSGSEVTLNVCLHRSTQLVQLTREFFSETYHFIIDGKNYEIGKLTAVEWTSGGNVAYTITARQYQTTNWIDGETETRYLDYETIKGVLTFDENNNIYATSPTIKQN